MSRVAGAGGGPVLEILASGVVFGCAHMIWGVVTGHWRTGLRVAAITGALGLALGVVFCCRTACCRPSSSPTS
jgi:hypothetical protein